jgi:hypothetical protein
MKRPIRYARTIVIAGALLAAAATAAAFARPTGTSQITPAQVKRIARSVADAEIGRLAPRLSVKSAQTASSATSANAPALYAQVTGSGAVTTNSEGIVQANIIRPHKGLYCFVGLPSAPKGGVVTIDAAIPGTGSGGDLAQVGLGRIVHRLVGECPTGTQAYVVTFTPAGEVVDDPFFVVLWT